jgi:hypothetical protein
VETATVGERVKVADGGQSLDGIVFDTPSRSKVVVAVMDPNRGPRFRTVSPRTLTPREGEGADDRALELLVRRTPPPVRGAARGAVAGGHVQRGFTRGAAHRPTGK